MWTAPIILINLTSYCSWNISAAEIEYGILSDLNCFVFVFRTCVLVKRVLRQRATRSNRKGDLVEPRWYCQRLHNAIWYLSQSPLCLRISFLGSVYLLPVVVNCIVYSLPTSSFSLRPPREGSAITSASVALLIVCLRPHPAYVLPVTVQRILSAMTSASVALFIVCLRPRSAYVLPVKVQRIFSSMTSASVALFIEVYSLPTSSFSLCPPCEGSANSFSDDFGIRFIFIEVYSLPTPSFSLRPPREGSAMTSAFVALFIEGYSLSTSSFSLRPPCEGSAMTSAFVALFIVCLHPPRESSAITLASYIVARIYNASWGW